MLIDLYCYHKVLSDYYHTAHFQVKNIPFYSDHLLFERLYNEAGAGIDGLGERIIGSGMSLESLNLPVIYKKMFEKVKGLPFACKENTQFFETAMSLETCLVEMCEAYDKSPASVGCKNMVAGLADASESRIYLIKQRLNKQAAPTEKSLVV